MPKYRAYAVYTASKYLGEFEAVTEDAARCAAEEHGETYVSICHQCAAELEVNDDCHRIDLEKAD